MVMYVNETSDDVTKKMIIFFCFIHDTGSFEADNTFLSFKFQDLWQIPPT